MQYKSEDRKRFNSLSVRRAHPVIREVFEQLRGTKLRNAEVAGMAQRKLR